MAEGNSFEAETLSASVYYFTETVAPHQWHLINTLLVAASAGGA